MVSSERDILTAIERKIYEWLKHPIILLLIGSLLIWWVQQRILIGVDREEKALSKSIRCLLKYLRYIQTIIRICGIFSLAR